MLGWRKLLGLGALAAAFFLLSGWTSLGHGHSGTVSNVFWMDFLLGVLLLIVLGAAAAARAAVSLWRYWARRESYPRSSSRSP